MDKDKLIVIKKRLLALGLSSIMLGTVGCTNNKRSDNGMPSRVAISEEIYNIEKYYKYIMKNGEAVKEYNSQNVYLLFNKETYEVKEYIFTNKVTVFGGAELYDLVTEEMLAYSDGVATIINKDYYKYLVDNNYQVCLTEVGDYVEGHSTKEYYTLAEIKELEPTIKESLKIINKAKTKKLN